jgi:hypothetical protein
VLTTRAPTFTTIGETTMTFDDTLDDLQAQMEAEGYLFGPPTSLPAFALAIDRSVAREASCDRCGGSRLICIPFHKGSSYRCLAACPECFEAFEF